MSCRASDRSVEESLMAMPVDYVQDVNNSKRQSDLNEERGE